ncbi:MAG TPA: peptidase E [Candidatus Limnocylindria bacterium]|nr:peptidase E [Candidatus Limnocylindria bacterium]
MTRRVLACGGKQLDHPGLTRYLFSLARRARPRILFLGTASGDDDGYLLTFYQRLAGLDCEPSHLPLFDRTSDDPADAIRAQDIVMVGGGNTANMLAIWRLHGVDRALREAYGQGTVLTGWSAGCLCWFECGITDSFGAQLAPLRDGLGILKGSACPHFDGEERRRPVYIAAVRDGLAPGIALEDAVAARYDDERLIEIVSARPDGRAFRVDRAGEHPLDVRVL